MDTRIALYPGAQVSFPGMVCTIEKEMGRGSNAIVYQGWYPDAQDPAQHHRVLVKELFPWHEGGGICRTEAGIVVSPEARDACMMHRESFLWGRDIHLALRERYPSFVGGNINTFEAGGTLYSLLDFTGGRTFEKEMDAPALTLRTLTERIIGVAECLSIFHEMDFLHLDISPDNILLLHRGAQTCVELIDYNSVIRTSDLKKGGPLRLSMKSGYTAPEVRMNAAASIGPWTDLYAVMAVFYRCLMGTPLTRMQQSGVTPISTDASPLLRDAPETVRSFVGAMVHKGLAPVAKRRYHSCMELLTDLTELLDRIDGVGVTHWALWEMGRKAITRELRNNPALRYITEEGGVYPTGITAPEGSGITAFLHGGGCAVLRGSGGMGKTTLLMRTAHEAAQRYRPDRPAVVYLSLYGYREGDATYIHDSLLRRMQYRKEVATYEGARHELDHLLQRPLRGKHGRAPVLLLLLDGGNETLGDTAALRQEIASLAAMEGVGILLASRNEMAELSFPLWEMQPLTPETTADVLARNGLLQPEGEEMRTLLANPMMLSLYVRACLDGEMQLHIRSREELITAYLTALLDKALRGLPDSSPQRWQIDAAVQCVYPLLADAEGRTRGAAMLDPVMRLYPLLGKAALRRRCPAWVGHMGDIRGNAADGDAWCGLMVHDLLWRKLGLLCRDEQGSYRLVHQEFRDVLAQQGREVRALILREQRMRAAAVAAIGGAAALALGLLLMQFLRTGAPIALPTPTPVPVYSAEKAMDVLDDVHALYGSLNAQYVAMLSLLENPTPDTMGIDEATFLLIPDFAITRSTLQADVGLMALGGAERAESAARTQADALCADGYRFPWNENSFDSAGYGDMAALVVSQQARYLDYVNRMDTVHRVTPAEYPGYIALIRNVIDADAQVAAIYGEWLYMRAMNGMPEWEKIDGAPWQGAYQRFMKARSAYAEVDAFRSACAGAENSSELIALLSAAIDHAQDVQGTLDRSLTYERARQKDGKE